MAGPVAQMIVDRAAPHRPQVRTVDAGKLAEGEVRLAVERFALTSNNVTYAVLGDVLDYWRFFPTGDVGLGIVPAWGFSRVIESKVEGVEVGERLYGLVPMVTSFVIRPGHVDATSVLDASPHRKGLAAAYQRSLRVAMDDLHDESTGDLELLLRPLFSTAFLLDDQISDPAGPHADTVVVTSASSKTAVALAHLLGERENVRVIGLTSMGKVDLVRSWGLYDEVAGYRFIHDVLTAAPLGWTQLVDFAGRPGIVADVHHAVGRDLSASHVVGITHHGALGTKAPPLPGPKPTTFFAPDRGAELAKHIGRDVMASRVADAWRGFVPRAAAMLSIRQVDGLEAAGADWKRFVVGKVDASEGVVVVP